MAGISVGGGHGNKKPVDADIPLIPFIDLLLCCVMFLLVTAVWNRMARINANQQIPGQEAPLDSPPPEQKIRLWLQVQNTGYSLKSDIGDVVTIPKAGSDYDLEELRTKLQDRRRLEPNRKDIIVAPEDGVRYKDIVAAMDLVVGEGYSDMSLQDGAPAI